MKFSGKKVFLITLLLLIVLTTEIKKRRHKRPEPEIEQIEEQQIEEPEEQQEYELQPFEGPCWDDDDCLSGRCMIGHCAKECETDEDCESKFCDRGFDAKMERMYCLKALGRHCGEDSDCAEGSCNGKTHICEIMNDDLMPFKGKSRGGILQ